MSGLKNVTWTVLNFDDPPDSEFILDIHDNMKKSFNSTTTIASNFTQIVLETDVNLVCKVAGLFAVNLLIVIGNILILLAVCMDKTLRTVTTYFIVNLAIADLLLGVIVIPFAGSYQIMGVWVFGENFCVIWAATDVLCSTASIYGLCCIGIDRYIGVTMPLKHHLIMTKKKALLIIGFSWACSFAIAIGPIFGWRPARDDPNQCPMSDSVDYVLFSTSCSFYIPLLIVVIMYYRIYREVSMQNKGLQAGHKTSVITSEGPSSVTLRIHVCISANHKNFVKSSFSQKVATFNRQKRAAKTLGLVIGGFIICWFPFFFVFPLSKICSSCTSLKVIHTCIWLGYCNSFLNPFIYAYSNRSFRNAFKHLLTCQCSKARSRQRDFRNLTNINRYTPTGKDSPILTPAKYRSMSKPHSPAAVKRTSYRRQSMMKRKMMEHILEQDVESSLTDDQENSPYKQNISNNQPEVGSTSIKNCSENESLPNTYANRAKSTEAYQNENSNLNNLESSDSEEDDDCSFIDNLQNMERFFDENTRIYQNFLKTRSTLLPQTGRRPSAPSAHISVFVETRANSKRRGSFFV